MLQGKEEPLLPGMHQIQGAQSKTFTPVPFSPPLSISQMIDFHMAKSPDHPVMVWKKEDRSEQVQTVNWKEFGRAVHRIARQIATALGYDLDKGEQAPQDTCVAIMAAGDHQTYLALLMGIVRAGCIAFPLSTNNSLAATVHLLESKACTLVVGNRSGAIPNLEQIVTDALKEVPCRFLEWVPFEHVFLGEEAGFDALPMTLTSEDDLNRPAIAFHSSGSTSFPKPIVMTHHAFLFTAGAFNYSQTSFTNQTIFIGHLPAFHVMAALMGLAGSFGASMVIGLFAPHNPPRPPNPTTTLAAAIDLDTDWLVAPPVFVQMWSRDEESIRQLKRIKRVSFGGGPLDKKVGAKLISQGVKLHTLYSATEIGHRILFDLYDDPKMWNWNKNIPTVRTFFRPMDDVATSGHYEHLVAADGRYAPNVFNDSYEGVPVFATNDLVELHPDDPTIFRVVGRKDDQIMLSSGEKTNPAPLQPVIEKSVLVKSCLYFGRGKAHNGILVEPTEAVKVDDEEQVARYRNQIWKVVQEANEFAPTHSRVLKEMIVVGSADKPFERTAKGSLRTGIVLDAYAAEIEAAYVAFNKSAEVAERVALPSLWDAQNTKTFVHAVVASVLEQDAIDAEQDIFSTLGADSLAATRMRNSISASLRKSKDAGMAVHIATLPTETVYSNPTINSLTAAVVRLVGGIEEDGGAIGRVDAMEEMLDKYSGHWPALGSKAKGGGSSQRTGRAVLLTGTTGGLGAHTLEKVIRAKEVTKIWALSRGHKGKTPLERHREAFIERGLDADLLNSDKVDLLEGDLTGERLGLSASVYDEIAGNVSVIYHIAWRLDFNLSLAHFEENVRGSRNLINVALGASAAFYFTSSIGVTMRAEQASVTEEPLPFSSSVGFGYAESKAVTERLVERARQDTGLLTCNVRIGQLSGSTTNGYWATTDWVPIMVKSAIALGSLPVADNVITWMPTDLCASVLLDLTTQGSTRHVVHPKPVEWKDIMGAIAHALHLRTCSFEEWVAAVEKASMATDAETLQRLPAIKLLDFFKQQLPPPGGKEKAAPMLDCTHSLEESQGLRGARPLSQEDANRWVSYWRSTHFLPS